MALMHYEIVWAEQGCVASSALSAKQAVLNGSDSKDITKTKQQDACKCLKLVARQLSCSQGPPNPKTKDS